jgi:hypothetical protein
MHHQDDDPQQADEHDDVDGIEGEEPPVDEYRLSARRPA